MSGGGPVAALLKAIFTSPANKSFPARCLFAVPPALILLGKLKKKKRTPAVGDAPKKKVDPISVVWKTVWPSWLKLSPEMLLIICGNVARVYIMNLIANNVRLGDGLLFTRDTVAYRKFVVYSIKLSLTNNLTDNLINFVRDRLARKWRVQLTKTLHEAYFSGSNYCPRRPGAVKRH